MSYIDYDNPEASSYEQQNALQKMERDIRHSRMSEASHGTAFIVEAMLLLFFLVIALAMTTQMTMESRAQAAQAAELSQAVTLAQNTAEEFAAQPEEFAKTGTTVREKNELKAECTVTQEKRAHGTMYTATITITGDNSTLAKKLRVKQATATGDSSGGEPVYTLTTSAYVSAKGGN